MDQINQPNKKIQQQQNQKSIMTIYGHRCPNMVNMGDQLWSGCPIMVMSKEKDDILLLWPDLQFFWCPQTWVQRPSTGNSLNALSHCGIECHSYFKIWESLTGPKNANIGLFKTTFHLTIMLQAVDWLRMLQIYIFITLHGLEFKLLKNHST